MVVTPPSTPLISRTLTLPPELLSFTLLACCVGAWSVVTPNPDPNLPPPQPLLVSLKACGWEIRLWCGGGLRSSFALSIWQFIQKHRGWGYYKCWFNFAPSASFLSSPFPTKLIFILGLLLQHSISLCAFSYDRIVSLRFFSYLAYLHSVHSPTALKEWRRCRKKMQLWKDPVKQKGQS